MHTRCMWRYEQLETYVMSMKIFIFLVEAVPIKIVEFSEPVLGDFTASGSSKLEHGSCPI